MQINIFEYLNYRDYLADHFESQKTKNPNYTFRHLSQKTGLSTSAIHMTMKGSRNISKDALPKWCSALRLNQTEQQYFDSLVAFNNSKDIESKRYYMEILNELRKARPGRHLGHIQYEFVSRWYYPIIRELVAYPDFSEDPKWIAHELNDKIKPKEAAEALETLFKLELIKRDERNHVVQCDSGLMTDDDIRSIGAFNFHQQMLTLAKNVMASTATSEREFSGLTMAVSKRQFNEMKRKIREFEDSMVRYLIENPDVPESVCQLNFQLFTLTRKRDQ